MLLKTIFFNAMPRMFKRWLHFCCDCRWPLTHNPDSQLQGASDIEVPVQDNSELEAIRQRRMQQLMSQYGGQVQPVPTVSPVLLQIEQSTIHMHCAHKASKLACISAQVQCNGQGGAGAGALTPEAQQEQEEARQQSEERRAAMLVQVLQPQARERCEGPSLAKPAHDEPYTEAHCSLIDPFLIENTHRQCDRQLRVN